MRPVAFIEGQLINWSPWLAGQMIVRGVQVGKHRLPRRDVAYRVWDTFRAWFRWTTALPGERFWDYRRDLLIEVAHGTPSRRTARFVTGEAASYPIVQKLGLDAVFALTTPEPCDLAWWAVSSAWTNFGSYPEGEK